jgi:tetratricopeptide (TPR) repeat protein
MSTIPEMLQAGLEHHRAGRLHDAELLYLQVLRLHPRHAGAVHLLGLIAFQVGKLDVAENYIGQAVKMDAFNATYPADLGEVYRAQGKIEEAIASYRKALEMNPEMADAQNHLATLLLGAGQLAAADAALAEALKLSPQHAEAQRNLGALRLAQGELGEARVLLEKAVQLAPESPQSYLYLGTCLYALGDWHGALACYEKTGRLEPQSADAQYLTGLVRLGLGEFAGGWTQFEARRSCPQFVRRQFQLPTWNGRALEGRRLLIHAEHGWGDTLQFIRYVPLAIERGATAIVDVPEPLVPLLKQSGIGNLVRSSEVAPECDVQAPLLSLPGILGTRLDTIPARVPYLSADPELLARWRERLAEIRGFRVGIAWQGDEQGPLDRWRWMPPAAFAPLAGVAGVRLIRLQTQQPPGSAARPPAEFEIVSLGDEVDTTSGALMDTAAVIANLDLVITADSVVAHLAGALGAKVWVALSSIGDWRWMQKRSDSPWYSTMRLFRQSSLGDWGGVFGDMAKELPALIDARSTR